ncbi:hypothetical protein bcere0022_21360 [Bacillus cereus Rock3-44]|nr:hypothetical protein bcere0022_21360 [Bacillus cereus Rock3-44]
MGYKIERFQVSKYELPFMLLPVAEIAKIHNDFQNLTKKVPM